MELSQKDLPPGDMAYVAAGPPSGPSGGAPASFDSTVVPVQTAPREVVGYNRARRMRCFMVEFDRGPRPDRMRMTPGGPCLEESRDAGAAGDVPEPVPRPRLRDRDQLPRVHGGLPQD